MKRIRRNKLTPAEIVRLCMAIAVFVVACMQFAIPGKASRTIVITAMFVGLGLSCVGVCRDFRRMRPRRRARDGAIACAVGTVVFSIMALLIFGDGERAAAGWFAAFGLLVLSAGIWLFLRWRKLRAEAEIRLWRLRQEHRRIFKE